MTTKDADPRADLIPPDLRTRLSSLIQDMNDSASLPTSPPSANRAPVSMGDYEPSDDESDEIIEIYEEEDEVAPTPVPASRSVIKRSSSTNERLGLKASRYLEGHADQAKALLEWMADLTRKEGGDVSVKTGPFTLKLPGAKVVENNGCLSVVIPSSDSFGLEMPPGTEVRLISGEKDVTALYMVRLFEGCNLPFQILIFLLNSKGD